jgi:predicted transcriptional regulator
LKGATLAKRETGSGRTIQRKRQLVGLTQHTLSKATNIPVQRITFAETGRVDLTPDELDRIWNVLRQRARKAMDAVAT